MRALVWAFVAALAAVGCVPAVRAGTVQVTTWPLWQGRPEPAHCSGFAVLTEHGPRLLTAAHCVRGVVVGAEVPIVTRARWDRNARGVRWARLVGSDPAADVAVLEPAADAAPELDAWPLADRDPEPGERVRVVSGLHWAETSGVVGEPWELDGGAVRWAVDASIAPGWSGSAVLDASGRVLGVVTSCAYLGQQCRPGFALFAAVRR